MSYVAVVFVNMPFNKEYLGAKPPEAAKNIVQFS